jgi:hypothetical protein
MGDKGRLIAHFYSDLVSALVCLSESILELYWSLRAEYIDKSTLVRRKKTCKFSDLAWLHYESKRLVQIDILVVLKFYSKSSLICANVRLII